MFLGDLVRQMSDLFSSLQLPATKSVSGLWAELFAIAAADDCHAMINAWHDDPAARFDFVIGSTAVEVKSTASSSRVHRFKGDQLVMGGGNVVIASIRTVQSGEGISVEALASLIRGSLDGSPDLQSHLDQTLMRTLGTDLDRALSRKFDIRLARASLKLYDAVSVPTIRHPYPLGVSDVGFLSDLSFAAPIDDDPLLERVGFLFGGGRFRS